MTSSVVKFLRLTPPPANKRNKIPQFRLKNIFLFFFYFSVDECSYDWKLRFLSTCRLQQVLPSSYKIMAHWQLTSRPLGSHTCTVCMIEIGVRRVLASLNNQKRRSYAWGGQLCLKKPNLSSTYVGARWLV